MLAVERHIALLFLASSILLYAKRGHGMALGSFDQILANLTDKYEKEIIEGNMEIRNSGNF